MSLINFWVAVSSPFLDTLDPAIEPFFELALEPGLEEVSTFACYFSEIYT